MSEAKKGEIAIRDKAILHQQRRLKQATQFTHKDSADLLPLDGLKRLGTSKDLVSELHECLNSIGEVVMCMQVLGSCQRFAVSRLICHNLLMT